ncbi:MAG: hypothetical protein LBQ71_14320 [Hungatella sp.]|jgi:hypothetical protein|nr:hypothetical protein [Hungatella sp.]
MRQARKIHRTAIESTYDGTCNIYEKQSYKDPDTKVTSQRLVKKVENQPCHLSFSSISATDDTETVSKLWQVTKLFLAPEITVMPGSKIEVIQAGRTEFYSGSGQPAVYGSHQEIVLELWKEKA